MRRFENEQLQMRYEHDAIFKERVDRTESEYAALINKAHKGTREVPEQILQRFSKEGKSAIYFFYGYIQPPPGTKTSELTLSFLKYFQPEHKEKFVFVYFNNETPSSDYYFEFKKILALLPLRIMENLKKFILVQPYFYIKAYDYIGLGSLNRIFSSRYMTLENCTQLVQHLKISTKDFVTFVPEQISSQFPKALKRRPSLMSYRINVEGQKMTEQQRKQKNQFQLAINALITKEIYTLQNYEVGDIGVPIIIQLLIHYFRTKPQGLDEEGLFRKSVSIDEENETLNQLSKRNYEYLEHIRNPHLIANLIKRFFSNLKIPLIPFKTYQALIHDQGVSNKKQYIKKLIKSLPDLNYITLTFLIEFLKKDVLLHESKSKMSANNLAICFSPSFMRSQKASMADLINASKSVMITNILINDFQEIFGNQAERQALYKRHMKNRDQAFKNNLKKELEIEGTSRASENEDNSAYSISINEPRSSQEIKLTQQRSKDSKELSSPTKLEKHESNPHNQDYKQLLPQPQVDNDLRKSEPPESGENIFDMSLSSLRAKSQGKSEQKPKRQRSKIFGQVTKALLNPIQSKKQGNYQ